MFILIAVPLTCWLCALIALPRRPLPGCEVQDLVYTRLLGRQRWLILLACVVTAATLLTAILSLPAGIDPDLRATRDPQRVCTRPSIGFCYQLQPNGMWTQEAVEDRRWVVVATVSGPPAGVDLADDPAPTSRKR